MVSICRIQSRDYRVREIEGKGQQFSLTLEAVLEKKNKHVLPLCYSESSDV